MPWLLWITGTPMWIRHGRLIDSRLPTTRPTPDPHLRNTSVTHKPHSFYDCGGLPIALPNIIIEFMQKERLFPMVMPEASKMIRDISGQLKNVNDLIAKKFSAVEINELADEIANVSKVHFYLPFRTSFIYSLQQNLWIDGKDSEYQCLIPKMLEATRFQFHTMVIGYPLHHA